MSVPLFCDFTSSRYLKTNGQC